MSLGLCDNVTTPLVWACKRYDNEPVLDNEHLILQCIDLLASDSECISCTAWITAAQKVLTRGLAADAYLLQRECVKQGSPPPNLLHQPHHLSPWLVVSPFWWQPPLLEPPPTPLLAT